MAKIEESYEAICDFFATDQFLDSCSRELYVHLKPKSFKNLEEMAKEADLFAEVRGGVYTCVNKAQRDNKGGSQHKSDSKPSRKLRIDTCEISQLPRLYLNILSLLRSSSFPEVITSYWHMLWANDLHLQNLAATQLRAQYLRRLSREQMVYPPEKQVSEE